ncbi:MAG TPA: FecR domain-containing protein [Methylocella sp.]|nr:FecR domain-containing protein [Methylocella sp.]
MSADDDTPENPHDAAIDWMVRMKEGALSRKEQAAFEAWLAADPANAAAYDDIEQLSADLSGLRLPRQAKPARVSSRKLHIAAAAAIAATAALAALTFGDLSAFLLSDYDTGTGETRQLILEDGSRVELDAKSAIALHFTPTQRRLTLLRGEAWFDVVPNSARPFTVEAMGGTVTALGTSFDISLKADETQVTVTTHRVAVTSGGQETIVAEGQQSTFTRDTPAHVPAPADVSQLTAWRRGKLIVADEALGDVLARLGRYRHGLVYCLRPAICARRVSGVYGMDDPSQALSEIETSLGLSAFRLTDYLIVLHE